MKQQTCHSIELTALGNLNCVLFYYVGLLVNRPEDASVMLINNYTNITDNVMNYYD